MVNFTSTVFLFFMVLLLESFSYAGETMEDEDLEPIKPRVFPVPVANEVVLAREVFPRNQGPNPSTTPLHRSYHPEVGIFYAAEVDFDF